MDSTQYSKALSGLGIHPRDAGKVFGYSQRSSERYASGRLPIPSPIAKLVVLAHRHRVKVELIARIEPPMGRR